jgi:hypothetical protein
LIVFRRGISVRTDDVTSGHLVAKGSEHESRIKQLFVCETASSARAPIIKLLASTAAPIHFERCARMLCAQEFFATTPQDTHHLDAASLARRHVPIAEEAAIRTIQFRNAPEGIFVPFQRGLHLILVGRISLQDSISALRAFGDKNLWPTRPPFAPSRA